MIGVRRSAETDANERLDAGEPTPAYRGRSRRTGAEFSTGVVHGAPFHVKRVGRLRLWIKDLT